MHLNNIASVLFVALATFLFVLNAQAGTAVARAVAAHATIAPEPEESGVCSNHIPSRKEFLAGPIPDQILGLYDIVRGDPNYEPEKDNFLEILMRHFTHIGENIPKKCNTVMECEIVRSCDDMKPANYPHGTRTVESQHGAYVILDSFQNLVNYWHMLADIYESAAVEMEGRTEAMVNMFTHNSEVAAVNAHNRKKAETLLHWEHFAQNVGFGLAGVFAMSAGPVGMAAVMVIGAVTAEGLDAQYKEDHIGKRDVSKYSGNATADWLATRAQFPIGEAGDDAATIVHHFGGLNATEHDVGQVSKHLYQWLALQDSGFQPIRTGSRGIMASDLNAMNTKALMQARNTAIDIANRLTRGQSIHGPNGTSISAASMIASGNFLEPVPYEALRGFIMRPLRASNLNTLQSGERLWVQLGKAYDGNCESMMDAGTQGPSVNRVCLPEYPQYVAHVYCIPRFQESEAGSIASLDLMAGWPLLAGEGWEGITQQDIVRSAIEGWRQNGNRPMHTNPFIDADIQLDPQSAFTWSPSRPGIFDIAVRYDEDNTFISSLNSKKGRQYPCEAGQQSPFEPPENLGAYHKEEAEARRSAEFFDKTKLSLSRDLKEGCECAYKEDRQRCYIGTFELSQWYISTTKEELDFAKHVQYNFKNCGLQPGSAMKVGKTQCERGNCK